MRPRVTQIAVAMLALVALALSSGGASAGVPAPLAGLPTGNNATDAIALGGKSVQAPSAMQAQTGVLGPYISSEIKHDTSPPLRSIKPSVPAELGAEVREFPLIPIYDLKGKGSQVVDGVVQSLLGPLAMPTPIANFEGMYNQWGGIPPDTVGDVGPYHYVQMVNLGFQVFTKTGASVAGPYSFNDLFRGFGGICEANNNGDPIVLYDQLADRWMLAQFAFNSQSGPTYQCIAISASGDPTGAYHRYAFLSAAIGFDDYPHYGVWPNAYYMTANRFNAPGFAGANVAYERAAMLTGGPARMVVYLVPNNGGALPSDMDGYTLPVTPSTNNIYYNTDDTTGLIDVYKFMVNWSTPISSTFTGPIPLMVQPWMSNICNATREQCVPQPDTAANLEAIADRFMHRIAYRNFGTHESVVANFTVNATGVLSSPTGIRWMEFRNISTTPTVFQQGTFAPNDGLYRWMGSISMDGQGNIAIGYSASSETEYPSIRYAGRLATDPPGQMSQGEVLMFQGTGSEDYPAAPRWGDYSSMNVDVDDCTFWYTTEYFRQTGLRNWRTRIGSFKFPGCSGLGATPTVTSTPVTCPIEFADVPVTNTFHPFVKCLACRGIVSGYPCGGDFEPCNADNDPYFRPNNHVTRGQLAKIVAQSAGFSEPVPSTQQSFEDVVYGSPFWEYVERLYSRGIIGGYQCGVDPNEPCVPPNDRPYFRPNNGATRGQLTKIVSEAAGFIDNIPGTQQTFEDVPPGHTFWIYVERLLQNRPGVMSGYVCGTIPSEPCVPPDDRPYFRPNNPLTRGQTSKIVANTFFPGCSGAPPPPTPVVPTATPTLCPNGISVSGSIVMTDSVQTGRVGHGSPASQCAFPKTCAAMSDTLPRHYDSYTYTNSTGTAQCVNVRVVQNCGDNSVRSIAYLGTYDPNNLCANYLADGGAAGPSYSYSFNLPAGSSAVVVLYENSPNIGCNQYHVSIDSCQAAVPTATATAPNTPAPTNTPTITPTPGACSYTVATATATVIPGGTNIGNICDDCFTTVNLPFPVNVYGTPVSVAHVGSNGMVQLATTPGDKLFFWDGCLPIIPEQGGPYLNTLFVYYDDLRTDVNPLQVCADCGIFTQTIGSAPNRQFVIRWKTTYFNHAGTAEFEAILTEGSGTISAIYGPSDNNGLEAMSGIQRNESVYTQWSCDTATLVPGLRVNFVPQNCGLQPVKQTGP